MNVNFDFALFKEVAPVKFRGIGATISRQRKVNAEEGALHKTARRLGAHFEGGLPKTDELLGAYGTRLSEISSMSSINTQDGAATWGIFATHLGADTTTIWAAATSGSAAIAVHIFTCMLARNFTSSQAISIWVEFLEKHKERIRASQEHALYSAEQSLAWTAAQQDISRDDLANWDSGA